MIGRRMLAKQQGQTHLVDPGNITVGIGMAC